MTNRLTTGRNNLYGKFRFTPCKTGGPLLQTDAAAVNVGLLSRASLSFDQFRYHQSNGEAHYSTVKSTYRGVRFGHPNMSGKMTTHAVDGKQRKPGFAPWFFEGKPRSEKVKNQNAPQ